MNKTLALAALALLSAVAAASSEDEAAKRERIERQAADIQHELFMRPDVARYCTENPSARQTFEIGDAAFVVSCRAWHAWRAQREAGRHP